MKDEIGVEIEYFLCNEKGRIVEPAIYGFPFDEFGFLVEIRTSPHIHPKLLMRELVKLIKAHEAQAESLGLELRLVHRMRLSPAFVAYLRKKYAYDRLKDLTANIYNGIQKTHATGLDGKWGTAGTHVHFSRKTKDGCRVQLPIKEIVLAYDARYNHEIAKAERVFGEYEIKPYGFEYRSLPATVSIYSVVSFGFMLLKHM